MNRCRLSTIIMRLMLAWSNWIIVLTLAGIGIVLIRFPLLIGPIDAAASLAGALFGAAAIFAGTEITKQDQRAREKSDLLEKQRRLRAALMVELVRISVNHMESAKLFDLAARERSQGQSSPTIPDLTHYLPEEPFVYQALLTQVPLLPEAEIDALATFYGNLGLTRKAIHENNGLGLLRARELANSCALDCEQAANVVALFAPERKIFRPGEHRPVILVEALRDIAKIRNQGTISGHRE